MFRSQVSAANTQGATLILSVQDSDSPGWWHWFSRVLIFPLTGRDFLDGVRSWICSWKTRQRSRAYVGSALDMSWALGCHSGRFAPFPCVRCSLMSRALPLPVVLSPLETHWCFWYCYFVQFPSTGLLLHFRFWVSTSRPLKFRNREPQTAWGMFSRNLYPRGWTWIKFLFIVAHVDFWEGGSWKIHNTPCAGED